MRLLLSWFFYTQQVVNCTLGNAVNEVCLLDKIN